ncbi:MAG TPA: YhcH/YjgK/YiaL family protein [Pirellulales bacterium]|nr:YhcH/YjgK/YiaL family protein [Pirellulales bacterium]
MILDRLSNARRYLSLHAGFAAALEFLAQPLDHLPSGRQPIDGERLFVVMNREQGRGRAGAKLESHRKYIDIQLTLGGAEEIGWKPSGDCSRAEAPFSDENDIAFYADPPESWFAVPPGFLAVFFPTDAHAPLGGTGALLKAVVKIAVDW